MSYLEILNHEYLVLLQLIPLSLSQHNLSSTLLSDGEAQELGHISDSCVKQLTQSNAVQMLGWSTEQEIQMLNYR